MKNKMLTYLLGFLVFAVWGLIIYKVFKATGADDEPNTLPVHQVKQNLSDYSAPKDTAHCCSTTAIPSA